MGLFSCPLAEVMLFWDSMGVWVSQALKSELSALLFLNLRLCGLEDIIRYSSL